MTQSRVYLNLITEKICFDIIELWVHYLQAIYCPLQSDHHPNYRWGSPLTQPATGTKQKPSPYLKIVEIEVARNQHWLENQQELTITG